MVVPTLGHWGRGGSLEGAARVRSWLRVFGLAENHPGPNSPKSVLPEKITVVHIQWGATQGNLGRGEGTGTAAVCGSAGMSSSSIVVIVVKVIWLFHGQLRFIREQGPCEQWMVPVTSASVTHATSQAEIEEACGGTNRGRGRSETHLETYPTRPNAGSCANSTWGLDQIEQVDLPVDNQHDWESDCLGGGAGAPTQASTSTTSISVDVPSTGTSVCRAETILYVRRLRVARTTLRTVTARTSLAFWQRCVMALRSMLTHGLRVVDASGGRTISGVTNALDKVVDSAERQIYQMSTASYGNHMWDNAVDLATDQFEVVVVVAACNNAGDHAPTVLAELPFD